jgi:hypothetical protein
MAKGKKKRKKGKRVRKDHLVKDPHLGPVRFRTLSPEKLRSLAASISDNEPDPAVLGADQHLGKASEATLRSVSLDGEILRAALLDDHLKRRLCLDGDEGRELTVEDGVAMERIAAEVRRLSRGGG